MRNEPLVDAYEQGLIAGLIMGSGSWTGDRQQGWLAIKARQEDPEPAATLHRLLGGHLYGPYHHGGRHYYFWRLQGRDLMAALPLFDQLLPEGETRRRYLAWKEKYGYPRKRRGAPDHQLITHQP